LHQVPRPIWSYKYGSKNFTSKTCEVYEKDIDENYDIDWEV